MQLTISEMTKNDGQGFLDLFHNRATKDEEYDFEVDWVHIANMLKAESFQMRYGPYAYVK